ncbi:MAG: hypothetical protein EA376_07155 [Phycisphaeraceae bacterium]|nr:MAG: hypothetical protein EA376_07155 [Phycisphaeraceae bacterium]
MTMLAVLIYFALPGALFAAYSVTLVAWAGARSKLMLLFLALFGLSFPLLAYFSYMTSVHVMQYVNRHFVQWPWGYVIDERTAALAIILCGLLTAMALWAATRSWRILVLVATASVAVGLLVISLEYASGWSQLHVVAIVTIACMLAAAIWTVTRSIRLALIVCASLIVLGLLPFVYESAPLMRILILQALWHGSVAFSLVWWLRVLREEPHALKGFCRHCGYDLAGLPTRICPECGQKIWTKPRGWRRWFPPQVNRR